ncbi:MAG: DNA alkylation repair protein [Flavobacterium sp.]
MHPMDFISELEKVFIAHANSEKRMAMQAYMKNNFVFIGLPMPQRRALLKSVANKYSDTLQSNARNIALTLFEKPQREFHYCAIEILVKNISKNLVIDDISWIEKLLITHSWWDTVDTISKFLLGRYLAQFPEQSDAVIEKFSNSPTIWLNRSVLLFQLEYKENTNFNILKAACERFKNSHAFFIQKAIGWSLREFSKCNPEAVLHYVNTANLKPLSNKEALKTIEKQKNEF